MSTRLIAVLAPMLALAFPQLSAATTLDPMVALFHKWQMKDASTVVEKAAQQGHHHVQFGIALQARLDPDHRVKLIGLHRESRWTIPATPSIPPPRRPRRAEVLLLNNPHFPALRSGHRLSQRPSRQKQIPWRQPKP